MVSKSDMRAGSPRGSLRWILLVVALGIFARAAMAQSGDLAIAHVTVINPGGRLQPDMAVIIHGNQIVSVSPSKNTKIPGAAQIVDGTGKFLIPGLWDMHVHFRDAQRDLKIDVANGVLGIRNLGGAGAEVYPLPDTS